MENESKRIIEINGIKMEVDLRNAKRIDVFKVGDPVKVLDLTYSTPVIKAGVIVGFAEFQSLPAIEIMVLENTYNGLDFKFITVTGRDLEDKTSTSEVVKRNYEIVHYNSYEKLFTQSDIISKWDKEIEKKEIEIEELKRKKKYFVDDFQKAFEQII